MTKNNEIISVPLSYEYMMSHLFGKMNYHGHVGTLRKSSWKKDIQKINKYIRKSIEINVCSDQLHRKELINACNELDRRLRKAKSIDSINVSVIEMFTKVIFLLLGGFPNHWRYRTPYQSRYWELNGQRSLEYHHSDFQKASLIIKAIDVDCVVSIKLDGFKTMQDAYYKRFNKKPGEFVQWFKTNYPCEYCEIF